MTERWKIILETISFDDELLEPPRVLFQGSSSMTVKIQSLLKEAVEQRLSAEPHPGNGRKISFSELKMVV